MRPEGHRLNRKGVMGLPIKLMVIMMVLAISVPVVYEALEDSEKDMADIEMSQETDRIMNAVSAAHYSGTGSSRTVTIDVPSGCEIHIGGEGIDSMSMRLFYGGEQTSTVYFERPTVRICDELVLTGYLTLKLTSISIDGAPGIEVTVL